MINDIEIITCNNYFKRLKGFMFTNKINKILCFPKCNSIHTFFMFKNIDIIMTDKENNVLYTFYNFKPGKIIFAFFSCLQQNTPVNYELFAGKVLCAIFVFFRSPDTFFAVL